MATQTQVLITQAQVMTTQANWKVSPMGIKMVVPWLHV